MKDAKKYFEENADRYDYWHKRNRYYYSSLLKWFKFVVPENMSVFELGMGDGNLCASLNPSRFGGIDFASQMAAKAKEKYPAGKWLEGDASQSILTDEKYDFVIASDYLSYVKDIQGALEVSRKLLHSTSRIVITKLNPFWNFPMRMAAALRLAQPRMYSNWLSQEQTIRLMKLAGYDVIKSGKFFLCPIYIPLLSNLINRYIAKLPLIRRLCAVEYMIARLRPAPITQGFPSLSVIIPARNESGNIYNALERMPAFPGKLEVVFVEGNSTDDTWQKILEAQAKPWPFEVTCMRQDGKGKGDAVRKGFAGAKGDLLMILDADLTVPPEELTKFYNVLADRRADYVQGTRLVYPMEKKAMRPLNWMGNKFFGFALSVLLGQRFSDTLCGTKCMWKKDYEALAANRAYFGDFDPFGDFDLIFGSAKLNMKIQEIPIRYRERVYGDTNINRFRDGWLLIKMCAFAAKKMYFI